MKYRNTLICVGLALAYGVVVTALRDIIGIPAFVFWPAYIIVGIGLGVVIELKWPIEKEW